MDTKAERKFDIRTLERNLDKGLITKDEYDAYLNSLPDTQANAIELEAEFVENILDQDQD